MKRVSQSGMSKKHGFQDYLRRLIYVVKYEGDRITLKEEYKHPDEIIPMVDSFW